MSKILFILHLPPPVHGAAVMGQYLRNSTIVNDTFDCRFINMSLTKDITSIGKFRFGKIAAYIRLLLNAIKTVLLWRPNLVYLTPSAAGGAYVKDFFLVMLLKLFGCKMVFHYHNKGLKQHSNNWLYRTSYRLFFNQTKVILLAESLYPDISDYVKRQNVFICPNGIPDVSVDLRGSDDNETASDRLNILYLGNMLSSKGIWILLDACELINDKIDFVCNYVGAWGDIDVDIFNKEICKRRLQGKVIAHGAAYGNDKIKHFSEADIFILPTLNECFPLVLIEAMQCSLPCISTYEGGIPDIVDNGKTGLMIDKNDANALADAIIKLHDNPSLRNEMGQRGREKYEKELTLGCFENRITNILHKCLD